MPHGCEAVSHGLKNSGAPLFVRLPPLKASDDRIFEKQALTSSQASGVKVSVGFALSPRAWGTPVPGVTPSFSGLPKALVCVALRPHHPNLCPCHHVCLNFPFL